MEGLTPAVVEAEKKAQLRGRSVAGSLLHWACRGGSVRTLRALLSDSFLAIRGFGNGNSKVKNEFGLEPIHVASKVRTDGTVQTNRQRNDPNFFFFFVCFGLFVFFSFFCLSAPQ